MKSIIFAFSLIAFVSKGSAQTQPNNLETALRYVKAYEELDFDKMGTFFHDSIVFEDLTYEEFYQQQGVVTGKAAVIHAWKTAFKQKPEYIMITVREAFASNSYVVLDQIFENMTKVGNKTSLIKGQMLTVLKFKDGKIINQKDFTEYAAFNRQMLSQTGNKATAQANPNIETALGYMSAYAQWNIDKMSTYFHDSVNFVDYTAIEAFPGGTYRHQGKIDVTKAWKDIFANDLPSFVNVTVQNAYATGSFVVLHTIFEMVLPDGWTPKSSDKVLVSFPIKTVLRFRDGKIISQSDFADYALYLKQINVQIKG